MVAAETEIVLTVIIGPITVAITTTESAVAAFLSSLGPGGWFSLGAAVGGAAVIAAGAVIAISILICVGSKKTC